MLRVGMTAGDIPDWTGQPDQGFEGFRFVGWTLTTASSTGICRAPTSRRRCAPGWRPNGTIDPNDSKRWIFELRKGVKFHDGCEWNADDAIWNIERLINDKAPQFHPVHFARQRARTNSIDQVREGR